MTDDIQPQRTRDTESPLDPFALAVGLLKHDLALLPPLAVVLGLSTIAQFVFPPKSFEQVAGLVVFDRLLQLLVLSFITLRWRGMLRTRDSARISPLVAGFRIVSMGFLLWAVVTLPALGLVALSDSIGLLPSFVVFTFTAFWSLRYFFYFSVFGLLGCSWRSGFQAMIGVYERAPLAPIRSLVAPIACTALIVAIFSSFSPDGRSSFWASASSAAEGVFWLLSIYTALGCSMVLIDDRVWREAGLDPYRVDRLLTLQAQGRTTRGSILSPSSGLKALALALLIVAANISQALNLSPAAKIEVLKMTPRDHGLAVVVKVEDPEHRLRGFNPLAFSVASQTGYPISTELSEVSLYPNSERFNGFLPETSEAVSFSLEFRSNKTEEVLRSLDNMWLWYNLKPLTRLNPPLQDSVPPQASPAPITN
jgi:hypothetical protein